MGPAALVMAAMVAVEGPWALLLRNDVEVMHQTLLESHPGPVDNQNGWFKEWLEKGYRQALDRVSRCDSFEGYRFGLEAFAHGFQDGHLGVHLYVQRDASRWPGFLVG